MKPMIHAKASAKRYGGKPEDYLHIHDLMDSSKAHVADVRHRMIFHSTLGCYLVEQILGHTMTNSDGKEVSIRDIAEDHVLEDLGCIPSLEKWMEGMPVAQWMGGPSKKTRHIDYEGTPLHD